MAAVNHSIPKRRRAALAAWAYGHLPSELRARAARIIPAAVRENPYCHEALSALADATRAGHLPSADAGRSWKSVVRALASHSHELAALFERALPDFGADRPNFGGDLALVKSLERRWRAAKLADCLEDVPFWRARILAARGKAKESARFLRRVARRSAATSPQRFGAAVTALATVAARTDDPESRLRVLRGVLPLALPKPKAGWTALRRSRLLVVRQIVAELRKLKRGEEADALWYEELDAARGPGSGLGEPPTLVGGGGGSAFSEAPQGAELIGLRIGTTGYNGRTVIRCVQAIYRLEDRESRGKRFGADCSGQVDLRAPEGWRVVGVIAAGSDRFDGCQLVFASRSVGDRRVRLSRWVGSRGEREVLIGERNARIRGIRGRAGADIDSFGLVGAVRR